MIELLEDIEAFRAQRLAENIRYYVEGMRDGGELIVWIGQETTKRTSRCSVCYRGQKSGVRKFWWRKPAMFRGAPCGWESFWVHPCEECLGKITEGKNDFLQVDDLPAFLLRATQHPVVNKVTA